MRNYILLVCFFYLASFAFAAIPLKVEIDQAISNLGHTDFLVRQKAFKSLEKDIFSKQHARKLLKSQIVNRWKTTTSPDIKYSLEKLSEPFAPYTWYELVYKTIRRMYGLEQLNEVNAIQLRIVSYTSPEDVEILSRLRVELDGFRQYLFEVKKEKTGIRDERFKRKMEAHEIASAKWQAIQNNILSGFKIVSTEPLIRTWHVPEKVEEVYGHQTVIEDNGSQYLVDTPFYLDFFISPLKDSTFNFVQDNVIPPHEDYRDLPHKISRDRFKEFRGRCMKKGTFSDYHGSNWFVFANSNKMLGFGNAVEEYLKTHFPEYVDEIEKAMEEHLRKHGSSI